MTSPMPQDPPAPDPLEKCDLRCWTVLPYAVLVFCVLAVVVARDGREHADWPG